MCQLPVLDLTYCSLDHQYNHMTEYNLQETVAYLKHEITGNTHR